MNGKPMGAGLLNRAGALLGAAMLLVCWAKPAAAQDIPGEWTGVLNWSSAGANVSGLTYNWDTLKWSRLYSEYKLELEFAANGDKLGGTYRCAIGATFAKFSIEATFADNKLNWKTLKRVSGYAGYCMNTAQLEYSKDDAFEYLIGNWKGCGTGKIYLRRKLNAPPPPAPEVYSWTKYKVQVSAPPGFKVNKQTTNEFEISDDNVRFFMHLWKDADVNADKLKETISKNAEDMGLENRSDAGDIEVAGLVGALVSGVKDGKKTFLYGLLNLDTDANCLIELSFPDGNDEEERKALDIVSSLAITK